MKAPRVVVTARVELEIVEITGSRVRRYTVRGEQCVRAAGGTVAPAGVSALRGVATSMMERLDWGMH